VSRLIFSLKPEDEDWDEPDFPYLYCDLDNDEAFDLESLVQSVTRPIKDDISPETLSRFATKMHDYLGSNVSSLLDESLCTNAGLSIHTSLRMALTIRLNF
jgi:maltodextrin utilization protein YvdJ